MELLLYNHVIFVLSIRKISAPAQGLRECQCQCLPHYKDAPLFDSRSPTTSIVPATLKFRVVTGAIGLFGQAPPRDMRIFRYACKTYLLSAIPIASNHARDCRATEIQSLTCRFRKYYFNIIRIKKFICSKRLTYRHSQSCDVCFRVAET